jgi:hypothetical protein
VPEKEGATDGNGKEEKSFFHFFHFFPPLPAHVLPALQA